MKAAHFPAAAKAGTGTAGPGRFAGRAASGRLRAGTASRASEPGTNRLVRRLALVEIATGAMAAIGGGLLLIAPDGSLLMADPAVLTGSPFGDYRWPGALLATLVGGGYLLAGTWLLRRWPGAAVVSLAAGVGLVAFEAAELIWLGFQPLEAVFAAVGVLVAGMSVAVIRRQKRAS